MAPHPTNVAKLPSTSDQYPPVTAYDEMVTIKVGKGEKEQTFSMPKGLLCFYSGYFSGALNGNFSEAKDKLITLEHVRPATFKAFQLWAYQRRIPKNRAKFKAVAIVELWLFGDAHLIPLLQNDTITSLRDYIVKHWEFPYRGFDVIYENTVSGSPLHNFFTDFIAKACGETPFDEADIADGQYPAMTKELLPKIWDRVKPLPWTKKTMADIDMCQYHVHEEGVKCAAKDPKVDAEDEWD